MKDTTKKEIRSCLGIVVYIIVLLLIGIGIVLIISSKTYEENGFKDTGLKTSDGCRLQYNENTNLVYTAEFKDRAGWVRIPYITKSGIVYSFDVETGELYIDTDKLEQELERIRDKQ